MKQSNLLKDTPSETDNLIVKTTNDVKKDGIIMTLCRVCKNDFLSSNKNYIRRTKQWQEYKETCDFCNFRQGYSYKITQKTKNDFKRVVEAIHHLS